MRIAVIHSFYRAAVSSGENNTVLAQVEALRGAGHEVELIAQYTDENRKRNPLYPLKAGFDVATGNGYDPTPELEKFQPDVVWVHNLFPNIATNWLIHCSFPFIATVYNYRPLCANGLLYRKRELCTRCPDGRPISSLSYGCYKNSRIATLPLYIRTRKGLREDPVFCFARRIILTSSRSATVYNAYGLDPAIACIVPNFVNHGIIPIEPKPLTDKWVVAARLSPEKGVLSLVESLPGGIALDIFGAGPEYEAIKKLRKPNVELKGLVSESDLASLLPSYRGMVFPSKVLENSPIAVLMALEAGIPVVAKQGSAGADLVEDYAVGSTYSDIPRSLDNALESVKGAISLRARAKSVYDAHFNPHSWVDVVERVLAGVVAN